MREIPACMSWPLPLTDDAADEFQMQRWQAGRCAMCDKTGSPLVLDHDHDTGLIRGYLCRSCNTQEGFGRHLPRFIRWRNGWNPARLMGIEEQYILLNGLTEAQMAAAFGPEPTMDDLRAAINRI